MQKARSFIIIIALVAWFAPALQLYILIDNTPENGLTVLQAVARFFLFFTILSNLLVAVSLTVIVSAPGSLTGRFFARSSSLAAIAVYIFIVGLIYNVLLRDQWKPQGLQKLADELLHVCVPLLYVLFWVICAPKKSLQWRHAFQWLVYPAVYLIYALARGSIEGFYPYYFINAGQYGVVQVALNCTGILVLFIITGLLFIFAAKKTSGQNVIA